MSLLRIKGKLSDDSNEIKVNIYNSSISLKSFLFGRPIIKIFQKKKSVRVGIEGNRTRAAQTRGEHYSHAAILTPT